MVFTNNMFTPECFEAGVDHALLAMPQLVGVGIDGVFLDGVVNYDLGCKAVDVNCSSSPCEKVR
jgi:hypothetical protein